MTEYQLKKISIKQDDILYSPQLVQLQRNDVHLLIDPASPNWASVNGLGSLIIRRCNGMNTLAEVTENVRDISNVHLADIKRFISNAIDAGMISTIPDLSPAYPGRSLAIAPNLLEELWINTNVSCPLRCRHCLVDGGSEPVPPLTTNEIKNLVDDGLALGVKRIYFTGGDPFLRKDLLDLVSYVTARVQLVVLTSGVLITEDIAKRLSRASHRNLLIQVSLEGPSEKYNKKIRGEGKFSPAVHGIAALKQSALTPIVSTTITKLNAAKVPETTQFLDSLGVKDHHILWLHARGRMRQNVRELEVSAQEIIRVMKALKTAVKGRDITIDNLFSMAVRVKGRRGRKNDLCSSGYGILNVNADGRVYPCAALCGAGPFDCGSTRDKSLREIWLDSSVANWVRENSVQKRVGCNSCYLKFICGGGCFAQSYYHYEMTTGTGCLMAPDPYCEVYKSLITELMWDMAMPSHREKKEDKPTLYKNMENIMPGCAADGNKVIDSAFDVGTYHCSCVLAMETSGGKGQIDER